MNDNQEQQPRGQQANFCPHEEYFIELHQALYDRQVFRSKEVKHTGMFHRAVQEALNKFAEEQQASPMPDGDRETLESQADNPDLALALDLAQTLIRYNLVRCNPSHVDSLYRELTNFTVMKQPFRYTQATIT